MMFWSLRCGTSKLSKHIIPPMYCEGFSYNLLLMDFENAKLAVDCSHCVHSRFLDLLLLSNGTFVSLTTASQSPCHPAAPGKHHSAVCFDEWDVFTTWRRQLGKQLFSYSWLFQVSESPPAPASLLKCLVFFFCEVQLHEGHIFLPVSHRLTLEVTPIWTPVSNAACVMAVPAAFHRAELVFSGNIPSCEFAPSNASFPLHGLRILSSMYCSNALHLLQIFLLLIFSTQKLYLFVPIVTLLT
jgi:hypothetical protein